MIISVRRVAVVGLLGVVLAGCGTEVAPRPGRDRAPSTTVSPAPATTPTEAPVLAPGPGGLTPVFMNGPRTEDRTVALTFDADMTADQGPRAAAGEQFDNPGLIAALRQLKVPSTVFMTGRWAEEYPDQARSIGHDPLFEVANHSYSHHAFTPDCYGLPTVESDLMQPDVERAFRAFRTVGIKDAKPYFRFPGGCYDDRALRTLAPVGVTAVQWDVVGGDAFATDAEAVAQEVLDGVRPGSVVVLHCTRSAAPTTERVIREVVPELRERGYRFVKVSDLIARERDRTAATPAKR
ncbi:polysaccharide deacetylase family protein [Streptomyces sp. NPDC059816]|uniref:polysaccharide deacetylase family protein n=1 Tax=Streptomyces sp. NPDC059816 TaxID=3346960 RepID=UPI0036503137